MNDGDAPGRGQVLGPRRAVARRGAGVTRSTMMGLPCLRVRTARSSPRATDAPATCSSSSPEARVDELVAAGRANSFAPAGRRFREWAPIPPDRARTWKRLLDEALAFVERRARR